MLDSALALIRGGGQPETPTEAAIDAPQDERPDLSPEEEQALLQLDRFYEAGTDVAYRENIKKILKAREFFRGDQYLAWNAQTGRWVIPTAPGGVSATNPIVAPGPYALNFYQAFLLSAAQLIVSSPLTEKFFPESGENPKDVAAAKAADNVMRFHEKNSDPFDQQLTEWLYLCTDGTFGSYVRYVVDGNRFGYHDEPIMEPFDAPVPGSADHYQCPECGMALSPEENTLGICQDCGAPMGPETFVAGQTMPGIRQAGMKKVPNGQEVRDVIGGLELRLPATSKEQYQFPFIKWNQELDSALLKATYPALADKIGIYSVPLANPEDAYARRARIQVATGTTSDNRRVVDNNTNLVTFRRTWFRPFAFHSIEDEGVRNKLLQRFPEGCFIAWADDTLCEARPENMDDHWAICHGMPGDGQIREPIFGSMIAVQEMLNDIWNILRDTTEFALPAVFVDDRLIDVAKFTASPVQAGAYMPVHGQPNINVNQAFHSIPAGEVSAHSLQILELLMTDIPQLFSGAFAAAFGGDLGSNDTARGIEIERDQAMGRIGMWRLRIKAHYAKFMPLIVKAFVENRSDPVTVSSMGEGGQFKDTTIDPEELAAGRFQARAEIADGYPTTWAQTKNTYAYMLGNPSTAPILGDLANSDAFKRVMGINDLVLPGEASFKKQLREIDELLKQQPVTGPPPMDPRTGTPMIDAMGRPMPGQPEPSIPIDDLLDTHQAELAAGKYWADSDEGQEARVKNPMGFMNVHLHLQQHQMAITQAAMAAAMPPPGSEAPPPA